MDLADYVLGRFSQVEGRIMEDAAKEAGQAAQSIILDGMEAAMNRYNAKKSQE